MSAGGMGWILAMKNKPTKRDENDDIDKIQIPKDMTKDQVLAQLDLYTKKCARLMRALKRIDKIEKKYFFSFLSRKLDKLRTKCFRNFESYERSRYYFYLVSEKMNKS